MTEAVVSKLVDNILSVFFCHRRTQSCHKKEGRFPVFPIQPQLKVTKWSFSPNWSNFTASGLNNVMSEKCATLTRKTLSLFFVLI